MNNDIFTDEPYTEHPVGGTIGHVNEPESASSVPDTTDPLPLDMSDETADHAQAGARKPPNRGFDDSGHLRTNESVDGIPTGSAGVMSQTIPNTPDMPRPDPTLPSNEGKDAAEGAADADQRAIESADEERSTDDDADGAVDDDAFDDFSFSDNGDEDSGQLPLRSSRADLISRIPETGTQADMAGSTYHIWPFELEELISSSDGEIASLAALESLIDEGPVTNRIPASAEYTQDDMELAYAALDAELDDTELAEVHEALQSRVSPFTAPAASVPMAPADPFPNNPAVTDATAAPYAQGPAFDADTTMYFHAHDTAADAVADGGSATDADAHDESLTKTRVMPPVAPTERFSAAVEQPAPEEPADTSRETEAAPEGKAPTEAPVETKKPDSPFIRRGRAHVILPGGGISPGNNLPTARDLSHKGLSGLTPSELDEHYMRLALDQARLANDIGEVPIGAVVVYNGEVIARGYNRREIDENPAAHAEFTAMLNACRTLRRWRLSGCTVYVTIEPCVMCAGLMWQARVDACVYGAGDPKGGALGTLYDISSDTRLNHNFEVRSGVLENSCAQLMKDFFASLRKRG